MLKKQKSRVFKYIAGTWPPNPLLILQKWSITSATFKDYQPPPNTSKSKQGCMYDALQFLNVIQPELGRYMSHLHTQKQHGTYIGDVNKLLHDYYQRTADSLSPEYSHYWVSYSLDSIPIFELLQEYLNKELQHSEATLLSFSTNVGFGHTTVVAKDSFGVLSILEPQTCMTLPFTIDYFINWVNDNCANDHPGAFIRSAVLLYKSEFKMPTALLYTDEFQMHLQEEITKIDIKSVISWPISKYQLKTWQVLNPEIDRTVAYDCYYNVFKFLNIIPHNIAENLSRQANVDGSCVTQEKIDAQFLSIMRDYHTDRFRQIYKYNIIRHEIRDPLTDKINDELLEFFERILKENLISGTGTIAWLYRKDTIGHCVIIHRLGNSFVIIDPQQCKLRDYSTWKRWFSRQNITHIGVIEQTHSGKRRLTSDTDSTTSSLSNSSELADMLERFHINSKPRTRKIVRVAKRPSIKDISNTFEKLSIHLDDRKKSSNHSSPNNISMKSSDSIGRSLKNSNSDISSLTEYTLANSSNSSYRNRKPAVPRLTMKKRTKKINSKSVDK